MASALEPARWAPFGATDVRGHADGFASDRRYTVLTAAWRAIDSGTLVQKVADALAKLGITGFIPDVLMWSPQYCDGDTKIVGPAHTVQVRPVVGRLRRQTCHMAQLGAGGYSFMGRRRLADGACG